MFGTIALEVIWKANCRRKRMAAGDRRNPGENTTSSSVLQNQQAFNIDFRNCTKARKKVYWLLETGIIS